MSIHESVLLKESVDGLNLKNGSVAVDLTLGAGGHSLEILKRILPNGKLIVFDQDPKAAEAFRQRIEREANLKSYEDKIIIVEANFADLKNKLRENQIEKVDGFLADLGISSDQLADNDLGISFQNDGPLDMRLSRQGELTAEKVVNEYEAGDLVKIFRQLGDEKYALPIVKKILQIRKEERIVTSGQLAKIIENSVPAVYRRGKIHPATKVFQALRMEVNQEVMVLEKMLEDGIEMLSPGGRMAVITFHSGEDRIVKNTFRQYARGCICPPEFPVCRCGHKPKVRLVGKMIQSGEDELEKNVRARSAKLRIIEKV